ncbi:ABC transporter substrate-binding protein [Subtercola sp. YIM 133946]|uniref:ABC transporter substrate-binding protein n=1 Tax=Subtercola sp. YIM 133946 TaxID=3118909 RepID=UPI002F93F061
MKRSILAAALAAAVIGLSGCAGQAGAAAPAATASGGLTAITVGVSPSTASAAVYLAQQKEFAEQGLAVTTTTIQSGAEAIPQLLNGGLTFALGDAAGTITASSNDIGITATGVATVSPTDASKDYSAIMTANPAITSVAGLAGKTVAVNQLKGIAQLTAAAAIDKQGGDSSKVQFVELAFPQMVDALTSGKVDAALIVEPFLSAAKAKGLTTVIAPQSYSVPGLPSTIFVASTAYATANPDIVTRFNKAVGEAGARANADTDLARQIAGTYTTISPDVLKVITLPTYAESAGDTSGMRKLVDLMNTYKFLDNQPDYDTLLVSGN